MPSLRPFTSVLPAFLRGSQTPRTFLEDHLECVEQLDGDLRAFRNLDIEGARRAADAASARYKALSPLGPIDGMVIGVKDIIDVAGVPTRMNSPIFNTAEPALQDAICIRAVRQGGSILLGKTETAEFACGDSAPTRNPHDPARSPGGSSSGSGSAVGAGMLAAAFGTQTQGSILRPASYCGAVGYKPSFGALPLAGIHPVSASHDHLGVVSASVADAWALLRSVSDFWPGAGKIGLIGDAVPARPKRLAVLRLAAFSELDHAATGSFETLLGKLAAAGVKVVCSSYDAYAGRAAAFLDGIYDASIGMMGWDMRWPYDGYNAHWPGQLGPKIINILARASTTDLAEYRKWLALRASAQAEVESLRSRFDAVLMPAASGTAPEGFAFSGSRSFQVPWTFIGGPAWSIPGLVVEGLPFGVQIAGFVGDDLALARHAAWLEGFLAEAAENK